MRWRRLAYAIGDAVWPYGSKPQRERWTRRAAQSHARLAPSVRAPRPNGGPAAGHTAAAAAAGHPDRYRPPVPAAAAARRAGAPPLPTTDTLDMAHGRREGMAPTHLGRGDDRAALGLEDSERTERVGHRADRLPRRCQGHRHTEEARGVRSRYGDRAHTDRRKGSTPMRACRRNGERARRVRPHPPQALVRRSHQHRLSAGPPRVHEPLGLGARARVPQRAHRTSAMRTQAAT
jgi:hypothetical protein